MSIRLKIRLENGVSIDTIVDEEKAKKIEKLKSYREIDNENKRRFKTYQKGELNPNWHKLSPLDREKRLFQLTKYVNDLCNLDEKEIKLFKIF